MRSGYGMAWRPPAHQSHVFRLDRRLRHRLDLRSGFATFSQPDGESVRRHHDLTVACSCSGQRIPSTDFVLGRWSSFMSGSLGAGRWSRQRSTARGSPGPGL